MIIYDTIHIYTFWNILPTSETTLLDTAIGVLLPHTANLLPFADDAIPDHALIPAVVDSPHVTPESLEKYI